MRSTLASTRASTRSTVAARASTDKQQSAVNAPARAAASISKEKEEDERRSASSSPVLGARIFSAVAAAMIAVTGPAFADLNSLEAAAGGEFGIGSAQQFGDATINGKDFSKQDLRRSNFTSAECRKCKFAGANLQGAYLMKGAFPYTDFSGANLSDTLADRAVLVESNFDGAILARAVLTRSDLTGSSIKGADFTNALVDRAQQLALCRVADGRNPTTGADTRASLGCGSRRRRLESTPSSAEGPQVSEADKEAFRATLPVYRK